MQCNQSFCGNGFPNGFYSSFNNNAPLQTTYPEIVGEGEVTSVTLPDGTIQFFFMPTVKWWRPNVPPCYTNVRGPTSVNSNYSASPYSNNFGTWFIRSISNPVPLAQLQNAFIPTYQRNDVQRPRFASECFMNTGNGFQVKFHNDGCSSTTDLHYFYPSLRKETPSKGTANVQMDTVPVTNTVCHYEVVCGKPCHCNTAAKPTCPQKKDGATQSMSLESLGDRKLNTRSNYTSTDECSCEEHSKKRNKRTKEKKSKRKKQKNVHICDCDTAAETQTVDKSMATYNDQCCSTIANCGETNRVLSKEKNKCCLEKLTQLTSCTKSCKPTQFCEIDSADIWIPATAFSKRAMQECPSENYDSEIELNADCGSYCGDSVSENE